MRMVIAGGGTGGHLFPGLALAEALRRRGTAEVLFIGSSHGIESRVLPPTGFGLRLLPIRGLRGRGLRGLLELAVQVPRALASAWAELRRFRPQIVVGVGGYASFPVVCAAWLRRLPTVLLEQNAHPGLTTRVLARIADVVCTGFPETASHLRAARIVCTGNPVRQWPKVMSKEPKPEGFDLLIFGGSQGAHRINVAAVAAAAVLRDTIPILRIVHQTGESDLADVEQGYRRLEMDVDARAFIEDMGSAYARADLVVCRAGATTLAELTALGKPSILIPYPYAADDHQRANAASLERRGAAEMILDRELTGERLAERVSDLARNPARLAAMGEAARRLGRPDAAERVLEECERLVGGGEHG